MTGASARQAVQSGSLINTAGHGASFPGLGRVGDRLARGLLQFFTSLGVSEIAAKCEPAEISTFGAVRVDHSNSAAFIQFRIDPVRGGALLIIPRSIISQAVDIFYGGTGEHVAGGRDFTGAELQFVERVGRECPSVFKTAWAGIADITATVAAAGCDIAETLIAVDHDLVTLQTISIGSGLFGDARIICVYTASGLRGVPGLSQSDRIAPAKICDPVWREKLTDAVMKVHLPVRSIFARPQMPLTRLLSLQVGDVIPVCLPRNLPMTVAGRVFAHGTVGESGGRAAIQIEKIAEGNHQNE